jgi:predicted branched-subunit amino acid permease
VSTQVLPGAISRRPSSLVRAGVIAGLSDVVPVVIGLVPFALLVGVAVGESPIPDLAGLVLSFLVGAGASQMATLTIVDGGGAVATAVLAGLVINARLVMYAAALAPRFRAQPAWFRWAGPHTIVDQTFALTMRRSERDPAWFRGYWLGVSGLLVTCWVGVIAVGIVAGPVLPPGLSLDFTVPVMFVALLMPLLTDPPRRVAALTAAVTTVPALHLPHGLGLLLGVVVGAAAGALVSRRHVR